MYDLEDLLGNAALTEFLIVTVPTELAIRESMRLLNDLTFDEMPIKVRNVVVNQVSDHQETAGAFLSHVAHRQQASITDLEQFSAGRLSPNLSLGPLQGLSPREEVATVAGTRPVTISLILS